MKKRGKRLSSRPLGSVVPGYREAMRWRLGSLLLLFLWLIPSGSVAQSIELRSSDLRQEVDMMGGDMERSSGAIQNTQNKAEILKWGFGDINFNVCRVQYDKKQELAEGVKNWAFYEKQVTTMREIRAINPDILFFATLRSDYDGYGNDNNLPDWICNYNTKAIEVEKYGVFLADYVEYMEQQGVPIAMMSVAKEWTTFVNATVSAGVITKLKSELDARGVAMPLISDQGFWSTAQGNKYLDDVASLGTEDLYWSFCNHNYGTSDHSLWHGINAKALALGKVLYNDESSHGGGGPTSGVERPITTPIAAYVERCHMYEAGVKGEIFFEIWSRGLNNETRPIYCPWGGTGRKMRAYYIMKHFANHVVDSCYFPSEASDMPGVHTMAFRKNDQVVLWVINEGEAGHSSVSVNLDSSLSGLEIDETVWTEEGDLEGVSETIIGSGTGFQVDIAAQSLSCFLFDIEAQEARKLPYYEGFESGFGEWKQVQDDDFDWSRNVFATGTSGSGPSSASQGDWYLYAEGHNANAPDYEALLEKRFDLSDVLGAELRFDYHMCGAYIDHLAVDVYDGAEWVEGVWIREGAQQAMSEDPWHRAIVDLSDYAGLSEVTVRFRTKKSVWHASDVAVDNILFAEPPQTLPYAESFESGLGGWAQSAEDDIDWSHHTGGTATTNTGPSGSSDGDWYLYVENHSNGAYYKSASVEGRFDLSTAVHPELTFDYHMFGPYIDFLSVDVHSGSEWHLDVWKKSGQQQSSNEDDWATARVGLSAFAGNDLVTIRFRSKQRQWHAADTAIDAIQLVDTATPYELWAAASFGSERESVDWSEMGNPDGDHFTNLEEWALVLDPMVSDSPEMAFSTQGELFTVNYVRRVDSGLRVRATWSSSLGSGTWKGHGDGLVESSLGAEGNVEFMSASVPLESGRKFIRIEVD
ncbi:hypothetical protein AAFN60_06320 [Roseibacillus persicicus]|uniref:hypothetical protein n=1 Tax=Roseibacillus persicicus TaxID=454148 RepID=UPI00398AE850